jgi:hypothetical protein
MMRSIACLIVITALASITLAAKGPTTRITIRDAARGQAAAIVDPGTLSRFNVWDGPGTFSGAPGQQTEGRTGFIIDWNAGPVDLPPPGLREYDVQFFVKIHNQGDERLSYAVTYRTDGAGEGFVYLPGSGDPRFRVNAGSIFRGPGYEGRWFHASAEWQQAARAVLQ